MKSNKEISRDVTNTIFAPMIEYVLKRGDEALDEILKRLNDKLHVEAQNGTVPLNFRTIGKAQLQSWLHSDPRKRIEPQFGIGTLMLSVWEEVRQEFKLKHPKITQ